MQLLDFSAPSPAQNLALDEALLEDAEAGTGAPTLRFWESSDYFVALGYINRAAIETNEDECAARGISILRRATGGGTVLQGPGCFNYALIDGIEEGRALDVGATNARVMQTVRDALQPLLNGEVEISGHTDLVWQNRKFSGNAQKRKSRHFLFHGTLLLDFDVELVQATLRPPSREPAYRQNRSHREFVGNVPLEREQVKAVLARAFGAATQTQTWPDELVRELVAQKYARAQWNRKF